MAQDFEAFAEGELVERSRPSYPPHVRVANVVLSSPDQSLAVRAAEEAARWIRPHLRGVELVGPAPAPIERLHGRWRWHFLLRSGSVRALGGVARRLAEEASLPAGDVRLTLDRDPVALL